MRRQYSQWDWSTMRYRYFDGPAQADPGGFNRLRGISHDEPPTDNKGPMVRDGAPMGVDIDAVLRPLPPGSRALGYGTQARGEVVRSVRTAQRKGLSGGIDVIDPMLDEMVAAGGKQKSHPGITVDALDYPPVVVSVLSGMVMGFGLGRAFGSTGRVAAWVIGGLLGLMTAGARRKAFLKVCRKS